jgi:hypothetical protein
MGRWISFFLAILVGVVAGLAYGWWVNPVEYVDTTPDSLKIDYKSDYVLMVAETYSQEADPAQAMRRLALLGDDPPVEIVRQAVLFAENVGYTDADIARMRTLQAALESWNPNPQGLQP